MDSPIIILGVRPLSFSGASGVIALAPKPVLFVVSLSKGYGAPKQTEQPQMGRLVLRRHIWGYTICLCPTKRMPGVYELN